MESLFSWERLVTVFPQIIKYLPVTLKMVVIAEVFGVILGILIAIVRINKIPVLSQIYSVFISFMRGTPILVQLLVVFYGFPVLLQGVFGIDINRWEKINFVYVALALNESAFLAEIFRSSILAIPVGQTEASLSVGLTRFQTFQRIILPQVIRIALPSYGVALVNLIQSTSLAYMIGVIDLMGRAVTVGLSSRHYFECYIVVTVVYVIFSLTIKQIFQMVERKLTYGRKEIAKASF